LDKLAVLYEYQQADVKLELYEQQLKDTPTRRQLLKLQSYLQKQKAVLKEIENKALVEQNELSEIDAQYDRMMEFLGKKHNDISEYEKLDVDMLDYNVVKDLVREYETIYENIVKQKRKAQGLQQKAEATTAKLKDMLVQVGKAQREFSELKKKHQEELSAGAEELSKLKKSAELAASKVDPALLQKYERIKQNKPMPVTLLKNGRCMGCNMELPSRDLAKIKKSDTIIECENCGRILYME
jgi:uncharacterized protein